MNEYYPYFYFTLSLNICIGTRISVRPVRHEKEKRKKRARKIQMKTLKNSVSAIIPMAWPYGILVLGMSL